MRGESRPILGVTMGDPAGIGPEVVAKGLARRSIHGICRPLVIGSLPVMQHTIRSLGLPLRVRPVGGHGERLSSRYEVAVLDPLERPLGRFPMRKVGVATGAASVMFIQKAVQLARAGCVDAIVTAPINKEAINLAGYQYPGHTELLMDLTGSTQAGMMIVGGALKIMFVTTHVAIRDLPSRLTVEKIQQAIRLAHLALRDYFGIARPRIGVAALNPHAGEGGLFGEEERQQILPAAQRARAAGIRASDPLPADTLFNRAVSGDFDGLVAMFHDQGLIPLKLVAFGRCVNLTIGLPIIRTSVDHGTAYDIAGKGEAHPDSLIEAMKLAATLARRRSTGRRRTSVSARVSSC